MGVRWQEWGNPTGHALVFLHGFLGDGSDWTPVVSSFLEFRCLSPDLPGHGQTQFSETMSWDQLPVQLTQDLKAKEINHAVVIGYSMGGRIALHWAERNPEFVQGIILESASPGIDTEIERRARRLFDLQVEKRLMTLPQGEFIDWWCELPMFGDIKNHPDYPALRERRSRFSPDDMRRVMGEFGAAARPSVWPVLGQLPIIGYVTGSLDIKYKIVARRIQTEFPNISVEILENAAHNCHFEAPEQFSAIVRQFLRAVPDLG